MTAYKQPDEAAYYGYEFSALLSGNMIASITSVDFYAEFGHGGTLTNNNAQITGTQVRVLWGGGEAGTRYITTVKVLDTMGNPLTVSGEIAVGPNCSTGPCQWPIDLCNCGCSPCACPPSVTCLDDGTGTTIPVYGGPLKSAIVKRAYGYCGVASFEFEISPEDMVTGLQALNDQMAVLGTCTGYNFPNYGDGTGGEESGLRNEDVLGASYYVAKLLAPQIGKQLQGNPVAERACTIFLARTQCIPEMQLGRQTPVGAGNRWAGQWRGPFFPVRRGHC